MEDKAPMQLTSWKEIAEHLRVAVRTAQAWECKKGLPVLHMPGKKGRVTANPLELDHWKQAVSHSNRRWNHPLFIKSYAMLVSVLLIGFVAHELTTFLGQYRAAPPERAHEYRNTHSVYNPAKNQLAGKNFGELAGAHTQSDIALGLLDKITFGDVDGDNSVETILHFSPLTSPGSDTHLSNFSKLENQFHSCTPLTTDPVNAREDEGRQGVVEKRTSGGVGSSQQSDRMLNTKSAAIFPGSLSELPAIRKKARTDVFRTVKSETGSIPLPVCAHCTHTPASHDGIAQAGQSPIHPE